MKSAEAVDMEKKAMLSQLMAGKTEEEIVAAREKAIADPEAMGHEVVNTRFTDERYGDEGTRRRAGSAALPRQIAREHEPVPCGLLLQGPGGRPRMPHRARRSRRVRAGGAV